MRKDMHKVIVEKESTGKRFKFPRRKAQHADEAVQESTGSRESMRARWNNSGKEKGTHDHLRPLVRFLENRIGRPWDEVYSEIRSEISTRSRVQHHLLIHMEELVHRHVIEVHGVPCEAGGKNFGQPLVFSGFSYAFYVCPNSGALKKSNFRDNWKPPKDLDIVVLGERERARKIGDTWYKFRLEPVPPVVVVRDELRERGVWMGMTALDTLYGGRLYAAAKETLSKVDAHALERRRLARA